MTDITPSEAAAVLASMARRERTVRCADCGRECVVRGPGLYCGDATCRRARHRRQVAAGRARAKTDDLTEALRDQRQSSYRRAIGRAAPDAPKGDGL